MQKCKAIGYLRKHLCRRKLVNISHWYYYDNKKNTSTKIINYEFDKTTPFSQIVIPVIYVCHLCKQGPW